MDLLARAFGVAVGAALLSNPASVHKPHGMSSSVDEGDGATTLLQVDTASTSVEQLAAARSIFPDPVHVVSSAAEWAHLREAATTQGFLLATVLMSPQAVKPYWPTIRSLIRTFGAAGVRFVFVEVQDNFHARLHRTTPSLPSPRASSSSAALFSGHDPRDPLSAWARADVDVAVARLAFRNGCFAVPSMSLTGGCAINGRTREVAEEASLSEFRQRLSDWSFINSLAVEQQQQQQQMGQPYLGSLGAFATSPALDTATVPAPVARVPA